MIINDLGPTLETMGINLEMDTNKADKMKRKESEIAVEDALHTDKGNEYSLDNLDEEELDSYIVTEEEFLQKQKKWHELYATYLEEQKSRSQECQILEKYFK